MERVLFSGLDERVVALVALCIPDLSYVFNANTLLPEWSKASATLVLSIHKRAPFVMLWTGDEESDMERVIEYEPNSITMHYPDRLAALLNNKQDTEPHGLRKFR